MIFNALSLCSNLNMTDVRKKILRGDSLSKNRVDFLKPMNDPFGAKVQNSLKSQALTTFSSWKWNSLTFLFSYFFKKLNFEFLCFLTKHFYFLSDFIIFLSSKWVSSLKSYCIYVKQDLHLVILPLAKKIFNCLVKGSKWIFFIAFN